MQDIFLDISILNQRIERITTKRDVIDRSVQKFVESGRLCIKNENISDIFLTVGTVMFFRDNKIVRLYKDCDCECKAVLVLDSFTDTNIISKCRNSEKYPFGKWVAYNMYCTRCGTLINTYYTHICPVCSLPTKLLDSDISHKLFILFNLRATCLRSIAQIIGVKKGKSKKESMCNILGIEKGDETYDNVFKKNLRVVHF